MPLPELAQPASPTAITFVMMTKSKTVVRMILASALFERSPFLACQTSFDQKRFRSSQWRVCKGQGIDSAFFGCCSRTLETLKYEGRFTPPSLEGTLVDPATIGGVEWGGGAVDPVNQVFVKQSEQHWGCCLPGAGDRSPLEAPW